MIIGQKDKSFVDHLWVLFDSIRIVGAGPREHYYLDKRTGKTYISYHFETYTHPYLTELHHDWYKKVNGKNFKVLPLNIAERVWPLTLRPSARPTPIALAYWLAGDSHFDKRDGSIVIATQSFTPSEVDLLRSILLNNLNIESTRTVANKGKEQYKIRIPKREVGKLQQIVKPYIPPMMAYRVGL